MSPIEHGRDELRRRIYRRENIEHLQQLEAILHQEWADFLPQPDQIHEETNSNLHQRIGWTHLTRPFLLKRQQKHERLRTFSMLLGITECKSLVPFTANSSSEPTRGGHGTVPEAQHTFGHGVGVLTTVVFFWINDFLKLSLGFVLSRSFNLNPREPRTQFFIL
ncbi:hypothetical protein RRG08_005274 [Elysia crispata]|uniref:Uncharacterized protein n=1 Tax=Elysia crispata TaxID=231223 RepID=A0AAE0YBJ3_9GAST|nr:hypothetical protein RRG08_005274 [Elysia crispata]